MSQGNYTKTPESFDPRKRFIMSLLQASSVQEGKIIPLVDADYNEGFMGIYNLINQAIRLGLQDGSIGEGFKVKPYSIPNSFLLFGGGDDIEDEVWDYGITFVGGNMALLAGDTIYGDLDITDTSDANKIAFTRQLEIIHKITEISPDRKSITDANIGYIPGSAFKDRVVKIIKNTNGVFEEYKTAKVVSNTENTITLDTALPAKFSAGDYYIILPSTPILNLQTPASRVDYILLDVHPEDWGAVEDPSILHGIEPNSPNLVGAFEAMRRFKLIQNVIVYEGLSGVPDITSYKDNNGNVHARYLLASINRQSGSTIAENTIVDLREKYFGGSREVKASRTRLSILAREQDPNSTEINSEVGVFDNLFKVKSQIGSRADYPDLPSVLQSIDGDMALNNRLFRGAWSQLNLTATLVKYPSISPILNDKGFVNCNIAGGNGGYIYMGKLFVFTNGDLEVLPNSIIGYTLQKSSVFQAMKWDMYLDKIHNASNFLPVFYIDAQGNAQKIGNILTQVDGNFGIVLAPFSLSNNNIAGNIFSQYVQNVGARNDFNNALFLQQLTGAKILLSSGSYTTDLGVFKFQPDVKSEPFNRDIIIEGIDKKNSILTITGVIKSSGNASQIIVRNCTVNSETAPDRTFIYDFNGDVIFENCNINFITPIINIKNLIFKDCDVKANSDSAYISKVTGNVEFINTKADFTKVFGNHPISGVTGDIIIRSNSYLKFSERGLGINNVSGEVCVFDSILEGNQMFDVSYMELTDSNIKFTGGVSAIYGICSTEFYMIGGKVELIKSSVSSSQYAPAILVTGKNKFSNGIRFIGHSFDISPNTAAYNKAISFIRCTGQNNILIVDDCDISNCIATYCFSYEGGFIFTGNRIKNIAGLLLYYNGALDGGIDSNFSHNKMLQVGSKPDLLFPVFGFVYFPPIGANECIDNKVDGALFDGQMTSLFYLPASGTSNVFDNIVFNVGDGGDIKTGQKSHNSVFNIRNTSRLSIVHNIIKNSKYVGFYLEQKNGETLGVSDYWSFIDNYYTGYATALCGAFAEAGWAWKFVVINNKLTSLDSSDAQPAIRLNTQKLLTIWMKDNILFSSVEPAGAPGQTYVYTVEYDTALGYAGNGLIRCITGAHNPDNNIAKVCVEGGSNLIASTAQAGNTLIGELVEVQNTDLGIPKIQLICNDMLVTAPDAVRIQLW